MSGEAIVGRLGGTSVTRFVIQGKIGIVEKVMRRGRRGFEGEWRKPRGLRELAGLRGFGETVEMRGKVKIFSGSCLLTISAQWIPRIETSLFPNYGCLEAEDDQIICRLSLREF